MEGAPQIYKITHGCWHPDYEVSSCVLAEHAFDPCRDGTPLPKLVPL
jgi:hypothetical protein